MMWVLYHSKQKNQVVSLLLTATPVTVDVSVEHVVAESAGRDGVELSPTETNAYEQLRVAMKSVCMVLMFRKAAGVCGAVWGEYYRGCACWYLWPALWYSLDWKALKFGALKTRYAGYEPLCDGPNCGRIHVLLCIETQDIVWALGHGVRRRTETIGGPGILSAKYSEDACFWDGSKALLMRLSVGDLQRWHLSEGAVVHFCFTVCQLPLAEPAHCIWEAWCVGYIGVQ